MYYKRMPCAIQIHLHQHVVSQQWVCWTITVIKYPFSMRGSHLSATWTVPIRHSHPAKLEKTLRLQLQVETEHGALAERFVGVFPLETTHHSHLKHIGNCILLLCTWSHHVMQFYWNQNFVFLWESENAYFELIVYWQYSLKSPAYLYVPYLISILYSKIHFGPLGLNFPNVL